MIYWDASTVVKLFVPESDSTHWREYADRSEGAFGSSAILHAEVAITLLHKEARSELKPGAASQLLQRFNRDIEEGRFSLFPVGANIFKEAIVVAQRCLAAKVHLRTLDAIHLATGLLHGCTMLATADERMKKAALLLGLRLVETTA